jgi:serine/threonine-protein kinase
MPGTAEVDSAELALPQEGDVLEGKYKIEHILGEGGMCVVYAARHLQLEERVAVKMLRPEMMEQPDIVERFLREGRAAIRIHSEHVVRIFDVGMLPSKNPYLVMECLEGSDLDALLAANGPLPIQAAVDYVLQAGEAIAEAHTLGIVHRDLKPANLFLTRRADGSPWVKVLDFGISKVSARKSRAPDLGLTAAATIMGSPRYMSPEQMRSTKNVDGRTDIWSLGAILHELIAGEPPFKGDTMPEICANILQDPPTSLIAVRPDVPVALEAAIMRCLEKNIADRFAHMGDVAVALAEFASPSGRASAHRIVGILQSSSHPGQGGILVNPSSEGTAWGSTDPSWDGVPRKRSTGKLLGIAAGAMTLVAGGALATFMFLGHPHAPATATTATAATSLTTTSQGDLLADGHSVPRPSTDVEAARDAGAATATPPAAATGNTTAHAPSNTAASRRRAAAPAYQPPVTAPAPRPRATNPDGTDVLFDERK